MDIARRPKIGLVAVVALLGSAFLAAPALADTQPDPTESNIPYLAWRGEQVRLVKCAPSITAVNQRADFLLVDWSGEENVISPLFVTTTLILVCWPTPAWFRVAFVFGLDIQMDAFAHTCGPFGCPQPGIGRAPVSFGFAVLHLMKRSVPAIP